MKRLMATLIVASLLAMSGFANAEPLPLKDLGLLEVDPSLGGIGKEIVIAVVDDAFDPSATYLNGMLWNNSGEIANNGLDDDQNGYIDDLHGWDTADMDEELRPPHSREPEFSHGIYTAGLIAQVVRAKLGERQNYSIKIMLIKSVSDQAQVLTMQGGYLGIDYAVAQKADIISNAWSGGVLTQENSQSLNRARAAGVLIINSVGNFPSPEPNFPAAHPAVIGVAGVVRSKQVSMSSNYGNEVDLVAISDNISGPDWGSENKQTQTGTSVSAPIVAATSALMKLAKPNISNREITDCLHASAVPVDKHNPLIPAKLGAGLLQIDSAINCAKNPLAYLSSQVGELNKAKGVIGINISGVYKWKIQPDGPVANIRLKSRTSANSIDAEISVRGDKLVYKGLLSKLPTELFVSGSVATIDLRVGEHAKKFSWSSTFVSTAIDLEKRYCQGRKPLRFNSNRLTISDGSVGENYMGQSDCQWLIPHSKGKSIRLDFTKVDLAAGDRLYLFSSDNTEQQNLLLSLSGNQIPSSILIKGGPLLLWFLSDKKQQASGFTVTAKLE